MPRPTNASKVPCRKKIRHFSLVQQNRSYRLVIFAEQMREIKDTRQSPWVETGAFSWRVEGDKFCLRFSTRRAFCPMRLATVLTQGLCLVGKKRIVTMDNTTHRVEVQDHRDHSQKQRQFRRIPKIRRPEWWSSPCKTLEREETKTPKWDTVMMWHYPSPPRRVPTTRASSLDNTNGKGQDGECERVLDFVQQSGPQYRSD